MADVPLVDLEAPDPPAPIAPVVIVPESVAPPEPPPDPDEVDAVDLPGGKHVPLTALKTVRAENKSLREKAAQSEVLAGQLAQLQGQIAGYQQVQAQLRQPQPAPQPSQPDPTAITFARSLDLYTQDASGQAVPDVAKATQILGIMANVAQQASGKLVQPLAQQIAEQRSSVNYQWALGVKDPDGKTLPKELVDEVWRSMPTEYTANPEIAKTLVFAAAGMDRMRQAPKVSPPAPPVFTEGVGATPRARAVMSELETRIAAEKGIKPEDWAKHTKDFVKGRTTILED